jgi:hypothetical protein
MRTPLFMTDERPPHVELIKLVVVMPLAVAIFVAWIWAEKARLVPGTSMAAFVGLPSAVSFLLIFWRLWKIPHRGRILYAVLSAVLAGVVTTVLLFFSCSVAWALFGGAAVL